MKKLSIICSLILFIIAGTVTSATVYAVEPITVAGGEEAGSQLPLEPIGEQQMSSVQKVEYSLPFPGILPDHPLYFLKRLRDTILEKLISDPIRKTEFYILQADKRLAMGNLLMEAGKGTLGESTISKAEKYMEQAISGMALHKKNGGSVPGYVIERLEKATAKHQEVITELLNKAQETEKAGLQGSMKLLQEITASIASLK